MKLTSKMGNHLLHLTCTFSLALASCAGNIKVQFGDANAEGGVGAGDGSVVDDAGNVIPLDDSGTDGRDGSIVPPPDGAGIDPPSGMIPVVPGEVDPNAPPNTGLPPLPRLVNVTAAAVGDSVTITFDPIDAARDYRVYALPSADAVTASPDGHVTITNAVYRCAGNRQVPPVTMDGAPQVPSGALRTLVNGQSVDGRVRTMAESTLGYVWAEPGQGRVPVYVLGDHDARADNECFFHRFTASRVKHYVTTEAARDMLLNRGFRDDGIAFYVPATQSGSTRDIATSATDTARYYFVSGTENRPSARTVFPVLSTQAEGSVPLKRAFYKNDCGMSHDELVAGEARFELIRRQGDQLPVTKLHWSGLTGQTTLVVEALDAGCPFQGLIGPKNIPAHNATYQSWVTPEDVQGSAPSGELYINGQFDGTSPRPIARSFVRISPGAAPTLDWAFGFARNDDFGQFNSTNCGASNCFAIYRMRSNSVDAAFYSIEEQRYAHRQLFGEWWTMYSDVFADTNGKYRLTPNLKAEMTADTFLYATMEVDSFTTARRYPQMIISDRDAPVQLSFPQGNTLVIQPFGDWPNRLDLQICDHKNWEVNDQCPRFDFYYQRDRADRNRVTGLAPNVEVGEQVGMDHSNRYEIYVSTRRAYIFLDGKPYGCAELPTAGVPSGPVTVTYGDVLYHSGVDKVFDYTGRRRLLDAFRHFDNLGFKSRVAAPAWNETRFPCTPHLLDNN